MFRLVWTDGNNEDFRRFYAETENYYNTLAGGEESRRGFIPHNLSDSISEVVIAYNDGIADSESGTGMAVGCAGLREYSADDIEIKRLWVIPRYRGMGIASRIMDALETRARERGCKRAVLQTRHSMRAAVSLYEKRGYLLIDNYPPYDKLDGAVCYAKEL